VDFSAAEKDSGVKLRLFVQLLSGMSFSHFDELWPRGGFPEAYTQITPGKNFAARLGRQSESGAVWWDMRLACKRTCSFACLFINRKTEKVVDCFYRAMHISAKRGIAIVILSVHCLSVCL